MKEGKMEKSFYFRDITDKTAEEFSGHLVALDHEFGGISSV